MLNSPLIVTFVPALGDNIIWLFATGADSVAAIDPGAANPVRHHLAQYGLTLSHILLTHHHADHTGGVQDLRQGGTIQVIGPQQEAHRLPPLDILVRDGDRLTLGEVEILVLEVPGHTLGHVVYQAQDALFSGDTLFSFGCGRLFEGTHAQMWQSLTRLSQLSGVERLFPGHEYTLLNLAFTLTLGLDQTELTTLMQHYRQILSHSPTVLPTPMNQEKRLNPFLRCQDPEFVTHLGRQQASPEEVFQFLRDKRNRF
ncbi:MAG: hydroxyacylglutathione hydrolase [Magnetococcus sp. DMHC-6]